MKFELEIVKFNVMDVITTSGCGDDCSCDGPGAGNMG